VKPTDLVTIRMYMTQLLRGLQYLHDVAGVVHGDIKRKQLTDLAQIALYI
jgi:serine/threonine protein kinase